MQPAGCVFLTCSACGRVHSCTQATGCRKPADFCSCVCQVGVSAWMPAQHGMLWQGRTAAAALRSPVLPRTGGAIGSHKGGAQPQLACSSTQQGSTLQTGSKGKVLTDGRRTKPGFSHTECVSLLLPAGSLTLFYLAVGAARLTQRLRPLAARTSRPASAGAGKAHSTMQ